MIHATTSAEFRRLRTLCLKLPEAIEVEAWGSPTFRVRNKMFATYAAPDNNHGDHLAGVWCKGTMENQELLVASDPKRYFVPPYVGVKGWVGMRLNGRVNWKDVEELVTEAYRLLAGKRLLARLDE